MTVFYVAPEAECPVEAISEGDGKYEIDADLVQNAGPALRCAP